MLKSLISFRAVIGIVGFFMIAAIVIEAMFIHQLWMNTDQLGTTQIKVVLVDAVHALNTSPAIEPTTGRQFIPAYHIVLPASPSLRLYYRAGGEISYLWLTDASKQTQAIGKIWSGQTQTDIFNGVKETQICSRLAVLSFKASSADWTTPYDRMAFVSAKKLLDGRTATLYQNVNCPYGSNDLTALLTQVESF